MPEQNSNKKPEKLTNIEFFNISRWVIKLLLKIDRSSTTLYTISSIFYNLRNIANTYIIATAIDKLINVLEQPNSSISDLYPFLGIMLGFEIFYIFISLIRNYSIMKLSHISDTQIEREFYLQLQSLGIQTLEEPEINNIISRSTYRMRSIYTYLRRAVNWIAEIISIFTISALIISFIPVLIPWVILISLFHFLIDRKFRGAIYNYFRDWTERNRKASSISQHLRNSEELKEITIIRAEKFLDKKYYEISKSYIDGIIQLTKKWYAGGDSIALFRTLIVFFGYIRVFKRYLEGKISIGKVAFWMGIIRTFQSNLTQIISTYNNLSEQALNLKDSYTLFHYESSIKDGNINFPLLKKGPEIKIKDLSFKYPNTNKHVLKNINLNIKSGEKIAIVGPNGAGKTTLIKHLCRIYAPTEGEILINDYNLQDVKIKSYYQNIGILFQEFNRYPELTAKENILISRPNEKPDEIGIRNAASAADALDFIKDLPNEFDTVLSEKYEGGVRPSTGQWQKIAIARFFYRNAPLVMFDEPTASIDAESEYNIFGKIYEFFEHKTVIIISHRFSTVRNADRIIVIDNGEIVEEGTHTHLMSIDGKYAKAFRLQAEGYNN